MKPRNYYEVIDAYTNGKMSYRPEFYSGRGVTSSDLGPEHLALLHKGIAKDFGETEALIFCRFVEFLEDMSASAFLTAFERWIGAGMPDTKISQNRTDRYAVGPDTHDGRREAAAMGCVIHALFSRETDPMQERLAGESIKDSFFRQVGYERLDAVAYKNFLRESGGRRGYW